MENLEFSLIITKESIESNDVNFTIDNISDGDNYKFLDVYFENNLGEKRRRNFNKHERKGNQTLPRLAFQLYEYEISKLTKEEKLNFPTCRYTTKSEAIRGIFESSVEFKQYRNTIEFLEYKGKENNFVIYCWNIFSTLLFIQECLLRFGDDGDKFILKYRRKPNNKSGTLLEENSDLPTLKNTYDKEIDMLKKSRNLIFRGAPGTGKTYLARQMAAEMIGCSVDELGEHPQFGFVQFHPNYDYSDFVEGLRPTTVGDSIGFELQDGIFKAFCKEAIAATEQGGQDNFDEAWLSFWETVSGETDSYKMKTLTGKPMNLIAFDRNGNTGVTEKSSSSLFFNYNQCYKVYRGFPGVPKGGLDNYRKAIIQEMKDKFGLKEYKAPVAQTAEGKPFIFLIDEINRGDMAKIFGELFFSLDPNYRGKTGAISTQYANLHESEEKFYIPENVYIIGTMNDIDRSVDSFDFAMRRRFRFVEITAEDRLDMLDELGEQSAEAKIRLTNLNTAISNIEGLDSHYHIGPAYFLKLKEVDYELLWSDFIAPLLEEYLRGNYNAAEELANLKEAFEDTTDYGN
ncbi:McrB family protein [Streptococcus hillyeri]|uniref:Endonuclease n=1 Tax=Streptococcus hillyeri TaxID=2282420 RepID=A0A3L9DTC9_9STRE|nr:AAA family ATPase [Streptococcus hillyeri]RLY02412.1 endonuclease [Streptococcus hillyeri]